MVVQLVDTHCHLSFAPLVGNLDGVLARAVRVGVTSIIVPGYDPASWATIADISERPAVSPAFGLHPWRASEEFDGDHLAGMLVEHQAVAVGEIGLDFKLPGCDRDRQVAVFSAQLALAVDLDLPVILHCRGAFEEMIGLIQPLVGRLRGVVHAYSRGVGLARRLTNLGLHIAFGGAVTRPRAVRARRSAAIVPGQHLLVETDAPAIGLEGVAPEQVEPRHVVEVVRALAELRGEEPEALAAMTTANAKRLFGPAKLLAVRY